MVKGLQDQGLIIILCLGKSDSETAYGIVVYISVLCQTPAHIASASETEAVKFGSEKQLLGGFTSKCISLLCQSGYVSLPSIVQQGIITITLIVYTVSIIFIAISQHSAMSKLLSTITVLSKLRYDMMKKSNKQ